MEGVDIKGIKVEIKRPSGTKSALLLLENDHLFCRMLPRNVRVLNRECLILYESYTIYFESLVLRTYWYLLFTQVTVLPLHNGCH